MVAGRGLFAASEVAPYRNDSDAASLRLSSPDFTPNVCQQGFSNPFSLPSAERIGTELFDVFPMFLKQFERYPKRSTPAPVLS
jgi:hypothetical protein